MIIGYESVHQASLSGLGRGYFRDFRRGRGRGVCSILFSLESCPFPLETRDTQALSKRLKYLVWLFPSCRPLVARGFLCPPDKVFHRTQENSSGIQDIPFED